MDYEILRHKGERLLVVYPQCKRSVADSLGGHYSIALVPSELKRDSLYRLSSPNLISYGPGSGNLISLSSMKDSCAVVCVEQEVPTLGGGLVEPQEFVVPLGEGAEAAQLLAGFGKSLLSGGIIVQPDS